MIKIEEINKEPKHLFAIVSKHGFQYQKSGDHSFGPVIMRDLGDARNELKRWREVFPDVHLVRVEVIPVEMIDER